MKFLALALTFVRKNWLALLIAVISIGLTPLIGFGALFGLIITVIILVYQDWTSGKSQEAAQQDEQRRHAELVKQLDKLDDGKKLQKIIAQVRETITSKRVQLEDVLHKLRAPLYALMVQKYYEPPKRVQQRLEQLGFRILGNGIYILPPSKCPPIKPGFDIAKWMEEKVLSDLPQNYKYIINFATVIDLRFLFSKRVISKRGRTALEVLQADATFLPELLLSLEHSNISLSQVIANAGLGFLIDTACTSSEITNLNASTGAILKTAGCQSLLDVRLLDEQALAQHLSQHCAHSEEAAKELRTNAQFWHSFLSDT